MVLELEEWKCKEMKRFGKEDYLGNCMIYLWIFYMKRVYRISIEVRENRITDERFFKGFCMWFTLYAIEIKFNKGLLSGIKKFR